MFGFLKKLFTSQSERTLQALYPYIDQINLTCRELLPLTHDELRKQTQLLKQELQKQTQQEYDAMTDLQAQAKSSSNITEKATLFSKADALQKKYEKKVEKVLLHLLPRAFAIVKETTRRFKENTSLNVQATDYDKNLAKRYNHIQITGEQACWKNTWQVGQQTITWDMIPYDVQLMGAIVLHQGKIAEMATGEGKTLVAILPAYLNALAGRGVHIVTVNDYLSQRDAAWVGPIYQFHGLTVDCIDTHAPHSLQRKQAYLADITYGTNNEFIFDYLRDNLATTLEEQVQTGRNICFADEADYIWIDDARTPCIISGQATHNDVEPFYIFKPRIHQLYKTQRQLIVGLLQEAQQKVKEDKLQEAGLALFRIYRGLPKHQPFIQYLSEKGMKKLLAETESIYLEENSRRMPEADEPLYFTIEEKHNTVQLTEKGTEYLTQQGEDPDFFVLPDIATRTAEIENHAQLTDQEKITKKDQLSKEYNEKSARIDTIQQLLKAYTLFEKDVDYVIINQQVKIVDEKTGRILIGRRYSGGLHQAIEAKENVTVQESSQTYATITPQNYFRMYRKLAGMTGTAETEAKELWDIYNLEVVVIPTHKPVIREDKDDKIYKTKAEKLEAIAQEVAQLRQQGRPVLVGAPSVEGSEEMCNALRNCESLKKVKIQVLNAKQHQKEAEMMERAGQAGMITVATQMAGRGTDIKLSADARRAGGLGVLSMERHENRRVDRQLRGRSGRQGDPGSSQFFISLEDPLMAHFRHGFIGSQMDKIFHEKGEAIQDPRITRAIEAAQKRLEENAFAYRKRSLEYDDVMNMQRSVIYRKREHALHGDRLILDIMHMLYHTLSDLVKKAKASPSNYKSFELDIIATLGITPDITSNELIHQADKKLVKKLYEKAYSTYLATKEQKQVQLNDLLEKMAKNKPDHPSHLVIGISTDPADPTKETYAVINFAEAKASHSKTAIQAIESKIVLHTIDEHWKEHLQRMDALKEASKNAVYEQKDPLLIYKFEALALFRQLISTLNKGTITQLFKLSVGTENFSQAMYDKFSHTKAALQEHKEDSSTDDAIASVEKITKPLRSDKVASRNQRVNVRYTDGRIKENVKFKTVEEDLKKQRCVLVEN